VVDTECHSKNCPAVDYSYPTGIQSWRTVVPCFVKQMTCTKEEAQVMNGDRKFFTERNIPPVKHKIQIHTTAHPVMFEFRGPASQFMGPEPALGVSKQVLRNKISRWLGNQHCRHWQDLDNTQRQAQELSRDHVGVPRLGFHPSVGYNRVLLPDVIPCAGIFIW
jgi:hypothetical protein